MAQPTSIEWTEQSWNFLRGCRRVSEGCTNCYAERQAGRFAGPGGPYEGLVKSTPGGPRWTGEISFHEDILLAPLRRKKPTTYFVNSMSDLFYEKVKDEWLDKAFAVMALTPQHTYQILTKRPERMKEYLTKHDVGARWAMWFPDAILPHAVVAVDWTNHGLVNVWLGVSVEDQKTADERIPLLLQTPAAVRWISAEPLLGEIDLERWLDPVGFECPDVCPELSYIKHSDVPTKDIRIGDTGEVECIPFCPDCGLQGTWTGWGDGLDWCVAGGESGPSARPCDIAWIRSIVGQCKAAGVPVFVKQLGAKPVWPHALACIDPEAEAMAKHYGIPHDAAVCSCHCHERLLDRKGGDLSEWPEDLRVRETPA